MLFHLGVKRADDDTARRKTAMSKLFDMQQGRELRIMIALEMRVKMKMLVRMRLRMLEGM